MRYRGRSTGLITSLLATIMGAGCIGTSTRACRADDANPGQTVVSRVDLVDADLQQAIALLKAQTGVQIVIEASDKPFGHVTMSLTDKSLDYVLNTMCRAAGASLHVQDGVYIIGPKGSAPPEKDLNPQVKPAEENPEPVVRKRTRTEKIRLQNSRPTEILYYMGINQGYINELERTMQGASFNNGIQPYRAAQEMRPPVLQNLNVVPSAPPVVPTGPQGGPGRQEGRADGPGGAEAQGFGGGRGGGGGALGGGGIGGGGGGLGGLGGGGGIGGQGGAGAATALLPDGIETVIGYDLDNSIIAVGSDEALRELRQRINLLDIAPKQIMIKAEFISVNQSDLKTFGIDWQLQRANLQTGTSGFAGGPVFLNFASGNVAAQLRATLTESKGRLVNAPMVTTMNNVPVSISFTKTTPVFLTSPIAAGNGTVILQTTLVPVPAITGLSAVPRINGDDSISMFVIPVVSDVTGTVTGPDGTTAPILEQQIVPVSRRIRNGETMVIGGLLTKNDVTSTRKIPLLGDLPLVGQLFQSRDVTVNDTELLVFITPSIIRDTTAGGSGAAAPEAASGGRVNP